MYRPGAYQEAVAFLQQLFNDAGVATTAKEYLPGKPVLVATIPGTQPELKRFVVYRHFAFLSLKMYVTYRYSPTAYCSIRTMTWYRVTNAFGIMSHLPP